MSANIKITDASDLQLTKPVLRFCKSISPEKPTFVPLRPVATQPVNECFSVIPQHLLRHGGKQKLGWCIHTWRGVLIEAEFHCIWEAPEGHWVDISPKFYETDFIVFLYDATLKYTGRQINNIRKPISRNRKVKELIRCHDDFFRHTNKGNLADQYGEIVLGDRAVKARNQMVKLEKAITKKHGSDRGIPTSRGFIKYHLKIPPSL